MLFPPCRHLQCKNFGALVPHAPDHDWRHAVDLKPEIVELTGGGRYAVFPYMLYDGPESFPGHGTRHHGCTKDGCSIVSSSTIHRPLRRNSCTVNLCTGEIDEMRSIISGLTVSGSIISGTPGVS